MNPPMVQRFSISEDGIITPEHMGTLESDFCKLRDRKLQDMSTQELSCAERQIHVNFNGERREVAVHVLAADVFDFIKYDDRLQFLAYDPSFSANQSRFRISVLHSAGFPIDKKFIDPKTNDLETQIWLDCSNQVIFTLNPRHIPDIERMFEEMRNEELAASN